MQGLTTTYDINMPESSSVRHRYEFEKRADKAVVTSTDFDLLCDFTRFLAQTYAKIHPTMTNSSACLKYRQVSQAGNTSTPGRK
jgi:hypothetical protein